MRNPVLWCLGIATGRETPPEAPERQAPGETDGSEDNAGSEGKAAPDETPDGASDEEEEVRYSPRPEP